MPRNQTIPLLTALAALLPAGLQAGLVTQSDPQAGGIGYQWTATLAGNDQVSFQRHVGAWSWEDNALFSPGDDPVGWTHTSDWVALTLTEPTTFTLRLAAQAGVPWPSGSNPGRTASTASMFPSFTIWKGWDNDGTDDHTYNNDGLVSWAEDLVEIVGFVNNSTQSFAEATYTLDAGQYSLVLGSNAPATDTARQGYLATLTTATPVPEPSTALFGLTGLLAAAASRRRTARRG